MRKFKYNEYVCNILISIVYKKRNARCYLRAAAPACALNKSITLRIHGSHIDANKFCLEKATISISRWDCRQLLVFYVQFNCASIYITHCNKTIHDSSCAIAYIFLRSQ